MCEAMFWNKKDNGLISCQLCPKGCEIPVGKKGFCRVRENRAGSLYALNYGKVSAYALDPVEKKPLNHFYPGSTLLSLGTFGCNLRCGYCQNWPIAHGNPPTIEITPQKAIEMALGQKEKGCIGIAYTYSEPLMWYEYVLDTAKLARGVGLKNILVTNGYIQAEPLRKLLPYIDAMNIDLKAITDEYYQKTCAGHLEPVKQTIALAHQYCHIEISTILVPGLNDSPKDIEQLIDWVASINPEIPIHLSPYHPNYQFNYPPTPLKTLNTAHQIAQRKLRHVYLGTPGVKNINL